jgi:CRP-like cAMP-binding protein
MQINPGGASMSLAEKEGTKGKNRLLEALKAPERQALLARMTAVTMSVRDKVYEQNKKIEQIFFPLTTVLSIVSDTNDGKTAEVATVGNEGMLGLPIFFRTDTIPLRAFCQIPGEAWVMTVEDFQSFTRDMNSDFSGLLYRYTQALFNQLAQHAACSSVHPIDIRCARWLLMTHDRVMRDEFPLTHEFLAQMLGVRRASVTVVANRLQKAGLITYRQGVITIVDRKGLEAATCEHYRLTRDEYDRLAPQG